MAFNHDVYIQRPAWEDDWYRTKVAAFKLIWGQHQEVWRSHGELFTKCKPPNKGYCHSPLDLPAAWMNSVSMCLLASILDCHAIHLVMKERVRSVCLRAGLLKLGVLLDPSGMMAKQTCYRCCQTLFFHAAVLSCVREKKKKLFLLRRLRDCSQLIFLLGKWQPYC